MSSKTEIQSFQLFFERHVLILHYKNWKGRGQIINFFIMFYHAYCVLGTTNYML